jgi:putative oligomerization/nucleic acid binding protein
MRKTSIALVVIATVIGLFAVFAVWAKRQVLETDTWTKTSTKLLADEHVQTALSTFLVDQLYAHVNVEGELRRALPPRADVVAGPVAGGLRQLADQVSLRALQTAQVQQLWAQANARAHAQFIHLIEGGGNGLSTANGDVTLNLGSIVDQVGSRTGIDVAGKLPPQASQIVLIHSDELSFAQSMVNLLRKLALVLPLVALGLYALAIYLARGRRRETLRAAGFGFLIVGIAVLVGRHVGGNTVVDSLASTESVKPAVHSVWSIGTSVLKEIADAMIFYGILIVLGAWLAGPMTLARGCRRTLTPLLRERTTAYGALALLLLLLFLWSPTPGFTRLIPSIVLIVLFVIGLEFLRAQALRDFPDETAQSVAERWRTGWRARRATSPAAPASAPATDAEEERLAKLARLGELRDSGVLDAEEFAREKQRVLSSAAV